MIKTLSEKPEILITGAGGFIGRFLLNRLVKDGYPCRCTVKNPEKIPGEQTAFPRVEWVRGDITRPETLKPVTKNIKTVFHLAAKGHVAAASERARLSFHKVNVEGTRNLANACLSSGVRRFFHFSSTAAVGLVPDRFVDETTPPRPETPYQRSKYDSELVIQEYINKYDFPAVIFRPCMVYGPGGFGEFYKLTRLAQKGLLPKVGRKIKLTPLVHVRDVVEACLKAMDRAPAGGCYFICGRVSYPFDDIVKIIRKSLGIQKPPLFVPEKLVTAGVGILELWSNIRGKIPPATRRNIRSTIADRRFSIERARKDFGYEPKEDIARGIKEVIEWYRENGHIR